MNRPADASSQAPAPQALLRIAEIADGLELRAVAHDARAFAERAAEGRFFVACLGQFKRGKSTLLNALVGAAVLPAGVLPVTSVVTVLRHGPAGARVLLGDGWRAVDPGALGAWVSEAENPENRKGVLGVEVFVASPLLANGMCLVDTPGVGSVFAGNTEATRQFVPHVDAALLVVGADPPISAEELALAVAVSGQVEHLIVVLNKADRLADAERDEAARFSARILEERLGRRVDRVLEVSAAERLAGTGPARDWDALVARLGDLVARSGAALVQAAEVRGTAMLAGRVLRDLDERRDALVRPVEESARRLDSLRASTQAAERSLDDLGHVMKGEQERLVRALRDREAVFVERAVPVALRSLADALAAADDGNVGRLRDEAVRLSHEVFHRLVDEWRAVEQPEADRLYRASMARFRDLAADFVARLVADGGLEPHGAPQILLPDTGLRARSRFYYTHLMALTGRSPLAAVADRLRPRAWRTRAVQRQAAAYLERLIRTNASRITSDLVDQVEESRRALERDLRTQLAEVHEAAARALERARSRRAAGAAAVQAELSRLEALRADVESLRQPRPNGARPA
jgi:hypothetical protein